LEGTVTLTGWGRIAPTQARLAQPDTVAGVVRLLDASAAPGIIPRGLGRSYNNAAQSAGGVVISTARLNRILALDPAAGVVTCEAGVSLEQLMVAGLPHGWFVPVSPGTRQVTVGGAIAADVHGKNHHVAGSFARHVLSFDIVLPGGELRTVTEADEPELFWATAGGMGLTGLVVRADPFGFRPGARLGVPPWMPPGLINRYSVALANEAYYRKAPRARQGELQTIGTFFHPLDGIRNWNRVYGPGGFRQYQYVLPFGQEAAVRRSFELVSRARAASFVTVLKRFGPGDPGLLSFPVPGWTLALDVPARTRSLASLLAALDRLVVEAGGRVYLAKDSRVPAEVLAEMYPRLAEFRKLREVFDPAGILASDLSRRLGL
jgi:decaprenylphospho-beta-D-ribofuranose 2-oxidase